MEDLILWDPIHHITCNFLTLATHNWNKESIYTCPSKGNQVATKHISLYCLKPTNIWVVAPFVCAKNPWPLMIWVELYLIKVPKMSALASNINNILREYHYILNRMLFCINCNVKLLDFLSLTFSSTFYSIHYKCRRGKSCTQLLKSNHVLAILWNMINTRDEFNLFDLLFKNPQTLIIIVELFLFWFFLCLQYFLYAELNYGCKKFERDHYLLIPPPPYQAQNEHIHSRCVIIKSIQMNWCVIFLFVHLQQKELPNRKKSKLDIQYHWY